MSTKINDLGGPSVAAVGLPPDTYDDDAVGPAIDLLPADGAGFAVFAVGPMPAGGHVDVRVQESNGTDPGIGWADLPGAAIAGIAAAGAYVVRFERTRRYVRCAVSPVNQPTLAAVVLQPRKLG